MHGRQELATAGRILRQEQLSPGKYEPARKTQKGSYNYSYNTHLTFYTWILPPFKATWPCDSGFLEFYIFVQFLAE